MTLRTKLINRRYRLERRMTLSETTETWLGFDNVLHRAVGVTVLRQEMIREPQLKREYLQRSQIATALHHRGIVAAFDSGEDGDTPYLVTEYLGGEQLSDIIRAEAPFDADDVAILAEQVAGALDYAHQRGFVHGTLSAFDIIVDDQGATKVLGLGIPTNSVSWRADAHSNVPLTFDDDVQALAAIAFEMLTGEEPDLGDAEQADHAYLIDPDVPRNASDIVAIGLGAGPVRFSSAGAFARSLSDWRSFEPDEVYVAPPHAFDDAEESILFEPDPEPAMALSTLYEDPELEEFSVETVAPSRITAGRGVQFALIAALLLMLAAGVLVWQASDGASTSTGEVPAQIETLAELSGF